MVIPDVSPSCDPHPNFIAGVWRDSGDARTNQNPSDLDQPVGLYAEAAPTDVEDAVTAAQDAAPIWRDTPPKERGAVLKTIGRELIQRGNELGALLACEEGKTLAEAVGEVRRAGEIFLHYAGEAYRSAGELLAGFRTGVEVEVRRSPLGVIAVVTPWNFPMAIPAWKIAPALAYGNTVVFKPAELVPGCAWALAEVVSRAGLPAGSFNLVMGSGSSVGEALVGQPGVNGITFTGSNRVGRQVAVTAAERLARVQLELGGKNSLIVLDDADLDLAVECAVQGAFYSTGQRCTASSRLIVTERIYGRFVAALAQRVKALHVGHALDADTDIGPVVAERQLAQDLEYIELGQREGATAAVLGEIVKRPTRGHYLSPTLFIDTDPTMRINRDEIFGPIASVLPARDYDEALALANDTEFGLVAGIITSSLRYAAHFKRYAEVGMAMVNMPTAGMDFHAPFGGTKASSYGPREQGTYAREFFTSVQTAYVRG